MSRIYGNRYTIVADSALRIALSQVSAAAIVVGIVMPIDFNLFVIVRDGTVKLPKGSVSSTTAVVGIVMQRIDLYLRVITLDCALQIAFKK